MFLLHRQFSSLDMFMFLPLGCYEKHRGIFLEKIAKNILGLPTSWLQLYCCSKRVIGAASRLYSCLKISKVVVGTVPVALVTALPELLSSLFSVFLGFLNLPLGNITGSNI